MLAGINLCGGGGGLGEEGGEWRKKRRKKRRKEKRKEKGKNKKKKNIPIGSGSGSFSFSLGEGEEPPVGSPTPISLKRVFMSARKTFIILESSLIIPMLPLGSAMSLRGGREGEKKEKKTEK